MGPSCEVTPAGVRSEAMRLRLAGLTRGMLSPAVLDQIDQLSGLAGRKLPKDRTLRDQIRELRIDCKPLEKL